MQDINITNLFFEVRDIALDSKKRNNKKVAAIKASFSKHYDKWVTSKENVWYKKYEIELRKRQFLDARIEMLQERYKILERETEKWSIRDTGQQLSENIIEHKDSMLVSERVTLCDDIEVSLKPAEIEPTKLLKSTSAFTTLHNSSSDKKSCALCQNDLHPVYESLIFKDQENGNLRDTIMNMERQGVELIKKNKKVSKEKKLLGRENKNLDEMIKKLSDNINFLMQENTKMKTMYQDEIARLKLKIQIFEKTIQNEKQDLIQQNRPSEQLDLKLKLAELLDENNQLKTENKLLHRQFKNPNDYLEEINVDNLFREMESSNFSDGKKTLNSKSNRTHRSNNHRTNSADSHKTLGKSHPSLPQYQPTTEKKSRKSNKSRKSKTSHKAQARMMRIKNPEKDGLERTTVLKRLPMKNSKGKTIEYREGNDRQAYCNLI